MSEHMSGPDAKPTVWREHGEWRCSAGALYFTGESAFQAYSNWRSWVNGEGKVIGIPLPDGDRHIRHVQFGVSVNQGEDS